MKRVNRYKVAFEKIWEPAEDGSEFNIREICVTVIASDVTEAMNEAWKTVTVNPNKYEIVSIVNEGCSHGRHNPF